MSLSKWISIGAGWYLGGPIGAILGYYLGKSFFNGKNDQEKAYEVSLLILSSLVIRADGKILNKELDYVKQFFIRTFGVSKANKYFVIFNKMNKDSFSANTRAICQQINKNVNHASRLQIIHFLFGVSASDNEVHVSEINLIQSIANYLNINEHDFKSIKSMFVKSKSDLEKWFNILEISNNASDDEIKKAHRKMVMKYHPDKLQGVSTHIRKLAEDKFKNVQEAYEMILKHRKK
mgnify:CR=1 FL=1